MTKEEAVALTITVVVLLMLLFGLGFNLGSQDKYYLTRIELACRQELQATNSGDICSAIIKNLTMVDSRRR